MKEVHMEAGRSYLAIPKLTFKRFMWFVLATLVFLVKVVMCITILLIPIVAILCEAFDFWINPFSYVDEEKIYGYKVKELK